MNFNDKVVLITGASSGIGAATAIKFSKFGASLSLTGRNFENLKETARECEKNTKKPLIIVGDLSKESDVTSIIESTIKHYGRLDVLINNAGVISANSIENTSLTEYDYVMNTNVRAVYQLTMLAVPYLIKSLGNIVNVSSVAGLRSSAGVVAYCTSKAALDQMTRCVALDLAPKKVRVNSVNPGLVVTNLHKRGGMDDETYAKFVERAKETHPMQRAGKPEEVAEAIFFLASDAASNVTGVTFSVDGGRHAMCPR